MLAMYNSPGSLKMTTKKLAKPQDELGRSFIVANSSSTFLVINHEVKPKRKGKEKPKKKKNSY